MAGRQQARQKGLYDRRCKGAALGIGDLVLVKKTAWKGRHKIQDRWESDEYQVIGQPTPGIFVYEVKCIAGGKIRVLHCNLLLPLQGRIRQQEGQVVDNPLGPEEEEEEEEDSGLPGVPQAPQVEAGKRPASPQQKPTQSREASRQDASVDLLKDSSTPRLLPESLLTIESSDDEVYTDSITSHTTASDSTIGNLTFPLGSLLSRVEGPKADSKTESQFSASMPYLEDSTPVKPSLPVTNNDTPSVITVSDRPDDSVFASDPSPDTSSSVSSLETPVPIPEGAPEVLKGNPLKGMVISIPLTL